MNRKQSTSKKLSQQQPQPQQPIRKQNCRRPLLLPVVHPQRTSGRSYPKIQMTLFICGVVLLWLTHPLVVVVQAAWIDMDTPVEKRTTISKIDGTIYQLVRTVWGGMIIEMQLGWGSIDVIDNDESVSLHIRRKSDKDL